MCKVTTKLVSVILLFLLAPMSYAQKFSVVPEVGYLLSQIDGDRLNGFNKSGYRLGLTSSYPLSVDGLISLGAHYYRHGSRKPGNNYRAFLVGSTQFEVDIKSIGIELSYAHKLKNSNYYAILGLVYHRVFGNEGTLYARNDGLTTITTFNAKEESSNSFIGISYGIGATLHPRLKLNFTVQNGLNLMEYYVPDNEVLYLRPFILQVSLGYEIISSKSKSKSKKILKRVRTRKGQ